MNITKDKEELIINFGAFNYPSSKIASILGVEESEITTELNNKGSKLNILLTKGKDMSDYSIDLRLFELAREGDIKALEKLEQRKKKYNILKK